MSDYYPDSWVVLKIKPSPGAAPFYKVLAGWRGGYLSGDSWRMNSGITGVTKDGNFYIFHGCSGSDYRCHETAYGLSMSNAGIYNKIKQSEQFDGQVILMPEDTNYMELDYALL